MAISHLYPNQRPTLNLNFARARALDSRIEFSRTSTGTYVGSNGYIQTAATNEPRFTYGSTGECLGLLIERSNTNTIANSTTHDTTDNVLSVTANSTTTLSPDGTNNAIRAEGVGNTAHFGYFGWSGSVALYDVLSIYVKPDQVEKFWLGAAYAQSNLYATFDLGTSPVTVTKGSDVYGAGAEYVGNGWYRVWMRSLVSSSYGLVISLDPAKTRTALNQYVNIPTGHGLWVFGAQKEFKVVTSYIPTSGSTITRSQDICKINDLDTGSWWTDNAATIVADVTVAVKDMNQRADAYFGVGNGGYGGANANDLIMGWVGNGVNDLRVGSNSSDFIMLLPSDSRRLKWVCGWTGTSPVGSTPNASVVVSRDPTTVSNIAIPAQGTATPALPRTTMLLGDGYRWGNFGGGGPNSCIFHQLTVYTYQLPDNQLKELVK